MAKAKVAEIRGAVNHFAAMLNRYENETDARMAAAVWVILQELAEDIRAHMHEET